MGERQIKSYELMDKIAAFEIVEQSDSRWFRLPKRDISLINGIKLDNSRYFYRVYRLV